MSTATTKDLKAILNPREAFRFGYSINPATGIESLSRGFWVNEDRYQETAKFLNQYTDASTTDDDAPVETEYITSPSVGRAAIFTGKWVHSGCTQSEEADKLIQALTRVYDITTNAELFARQAIPTYDNNILNLFGLAESEGDAIAFVIYALTKESRAFCMAIADSDLVTGLAGAGWSYAARRFDVDPETNSARFTIACKKVANNAFSVGSPDLEWYSNKTTKQEQKHQLWLMVSNDDALTGLYTADSGYNVTTVSLNPSEGGMLTIQRTQLLEAKGASGSEYENRRTLAINPHGLAAGEMTAITIKNHHLKDSADAYGTLAAADTGYTLVDVDKTEEGDGLWSKVYLYEKPTWTAWDSDAGATNVTYTRLGKNNESFTRIWMGIQVADRLAAVTACKNGTGSGAGQTSGYRIDSAGAGDNNNGSITVTQTQTKDPSSSNDPGGTRLDYDGIILKNRHQVSARVSGGVDLRRLINQSSYGQLFVLADWTNEQNAAEAAWDWALTATSPHTATLVSVFDPSSGIGIGNTDGIVNYVGNGVWEAIRICYEENDALPAVPS